MHLFSVTICVFTVASTKHYSSTETNKNLGMAKLYYSMFKSGIAFILRR